MNSVLRYGGPGIIIREGGWADTYSVLRAVINGLRKGYDIAIVRQIATTRWLFALMCDTQYESSVKSRYQLAGVVGNDDVLVQISFIWDKSGHSVEVSQLIQDGSIYTKITIDNLENISCSCHKTKFGTSGVSLGLASPLGGLVRIIVPISSSCLSLPSTRGTWRPGGLVKSLTS